MSKRLILVPVIILLFFLCIYIITGKTVYLNIIGLTSFLTFVGFILPITVFFDRIITGKEITEEKMEYYILIESVGLLLFGIFISFNVRYYPTTPSGYFLRTVIFGFLLIGIYVIYKRRRKG